MTDLSMRVQRMTSGLMWRKKPRGPWRGHQEGRLPEAAHITVFVGFRVLVTVCVNVARGGGYVLRSPLRLPS